MKKWNPHTMEEETVPDSQPMKKSELYKLAQKAVLNSSFMTADEKLEVLRELMDKESTAKFVEGRREQEKMKNGESV